MASNRPALCPMLVMSAMAPLFRTSTIRPANASALSWSKYWVVMPLLSSNSVTVHLPIISAGSWLVFSLPAGQNLADRRGCALWLVAPLEDEVKAYHVEGH